MEYLVGAFCSLIGTVFIYYIYKSSIKNNQIKIRSSQSRSHSLLAPFVIPVNGHTYKETQSSKHLESTHVRVSMTNNYAYWIRNNSVYRAEIKDGIISEESTKTVDMMALDAVELEEMMFIIEKLTEGKKSDHWGSGDEKF
jgi:hypothetical protein